MLKTLINWLLNDPRYAAILGLLQTIIQVLQEMSDTLSTEIQQLTQNVARLTTVNASAVALLKGLHDQLEAALANAHEQGIDPAALQQLHDLNVQIASQTQAWADAVVQNTPAATDQGGATDGTDAGATGATAAPDGDTGAPH